MVGVKAAMPGVRYLPEPILAHYRAEGVLTDRTLVDGLAAAAGRWPERVALSEPGVTVTYRELGTITDRVAAAFVRLGLEPLDRVLFQVINSKELVYAFIGCLKAGLIPICTLAAHRAVEIGQIGRSAAARAHVVTASPTGFDLVGFARDMSDQLPTVEHIVAIGGARDDGRTLSFEVLWRAEDPAVANSTVRAIGAMLDPYQVCLFQLSGGTSGTPKIIPRFHNEYLYAAEQVAAFLGLDETVVAFTPNPMLHNSPMACFWMPALLIGGEVAIAPSPEIAAIAAIINERRPSWAIIALVHLRRLRETGLLDKGVLADVYALACGNGALELSELVGAPFVPVYGMTEGLLCFGRRGDSMRAVSETVGRSSSPHDEIRIVEPGSERDVPPGATGELIVRGPSVIAGYYFGDDPDTTSFTSDGYYRSGDLMRWRVIDGLSYLSFEGRTKDVVDRGGEKINCSEIEQAVVSHPGVEAVMCVAMPDPVYGERMCAFVVSAVGAKAVGVDDLATHLGRLGFAKFKYPERVEIVDSFPLTASGKPSKPMLREMVAGKLRSEQAVA